jgi:hypothetical protein
LHPTVCLYTYRTNVAGKAHFKVISQDESEALGEPLLRSEEEVDEFGDLLLSSNLRMETSASSANYSDSSMLSSGPMANAGIRRGVFWALGVRTMADALPGPLQMVVNSGKMSAAVFLGGYAVLIALWLPFWLFSFIVSEGGIYLMALGTVFMVGRGIIRMIAFPGSSNVRTV